MKDIHCILDMDGTLISESRLATTRPIARANLRLFFEFLFDKFATVSIWTLSGYERFLEMYHTILLPNMGHHRFKIIITGDHKINRYKYKPLAAIAKYWPRAGIHHRNSIIIDNYSENGRYNYDSLICVPTFIHPMTEGEREDTDVLLNIICYINSKYFREQVERIKHPIPKVRH